LWHRALWKKIKKKVMDDVSKAASFILLYHARKESEMTMHKHIWGCGWCHVSLILPRFIMQNTGV
jgi:hypothetical protein